MICDHWTILKAFEVLLCVGCLGYKWWTDEEASRLFFFLEKRSREWPLQRNVTWNQAGSWFADVTFGGYVIITIGLFVAHVIGELRHTQKSETFLLGIGAVLFFGAGCMIITSFDNVHESLLDNAIILGALAILTGFVFVLDICCLRQRAQEDKVTKQEKEFRMQRNAADGHKNGLVSEKVYVKTKAIDEVDKPQEKVISELRSSLKKKHESNGPQETHFRVEQEQIQTKENLQYGRKYLDNRGFDHKRSKQSRHKMADEDDNGYDYDIQSIKNYENRGSIASASSDDSSDDSEYDLNKRYNRKSRGSQTKRKHFAVERKMKDAETATDSPKPVRPTANGVVPNGIIQSPKISTTDPHKSDSPTSEEGYKVQPPPSSSYLLSNGKKYQPVITPSRIEKITVTTESSSSTTELRSVPSTPQDPGYVLHTASKWPNASISGPTPYQKWKDSRGLRTVQSNV